MNTYNGRKHETGVDEQEYGHPKKPKRIHRWTLLVAVLSITALAWDCIFHGGLTRRPAGFHATNDAVVAVRLGSGQSTVAKGFRYSNYDGWIVLPDADRHGQVVVVNNVLHGDVLWNEWGVFYGSPSHDFLTTKAGTQGFERRYHSSDERQRYVPPDDTLTVVSGEGFGFVANTVHVDRCVTRIRNKETGGTVGQCGSWILAITDTKQSPGISAAAFTAYAARSGDERPPTTLAAVVQLNDHDGEESPILAVAPMIDGLGSRQHMLVCGEGVIAMPTKLSDKAAASSHGSTSERQRTMVFKRWDLSADERSIIPVSDGAGNPLELSDGQGVSEHEAIRVGSEYRFVSSDGDAFTVDLTNDRGRHLFSLDVPWSECLSVFQVTETGVHMLKDRGVDRVVTLSYRSWEGGEWRDIFATRDLAYYLKESVSTRTLDIQSFALRPGWDGGAQ